MSPSTSPRVAPGTVLAGQYRVGEHLGGGGYGDVYRAHSLRLDRPVALKLMRTRSGAGVRERFLREAQIAKRLEHPNTVRLLDYGDPDGERPFLVWELLRGETLADRLARLGPMTPVQVHRLARQVLSSLEEAHEAGVVHRDIKPSNLMLCDFAGQQDFVKVLDFGVAKDVRLGHDDLTGEGEVLGTPRYMAPEQVLGKMVVPATDLYALGLVMAEALTAKPVLSASSKTQAVALQATDADLALEPGVLSGPLGEVIRRATRKRIGARFASAGAMRSALQSEGDPKHVEAVPLRRSQPHAEVPETLSPLSVSEATQRREAAERPPAPAPAGTPRSARAAAAALGVTVLIGLGAGSYWFAARDGTNAPGELPSSSASVSVSPPVSPTKPNWHPPTQSVPAGTDLRAFDPLAFLPEARTRARRIFNDARLTSVQSRGVWNTDRLDVLAVHGGHATYWFRSPSASKAPASHPANLRYEGRCRVVVAVDELGLTVQVPLDVCDDPFVPEPRCTMRGATRRFLTAVGSTQRSFGASFDFRMDARGSPRWLIEAGTVGSEFLPDDCP